MKEKENIFIDSNKEKIEEIKIEKTDKKHKNYIKIFLEKISTQNREKKGKTYNKNDYKDYEKVLQKSTKRKQNILIATGIALAVVLLGVFCVIFSLLNVNNKNIFNNISIQGIDVSGMTQDEARVRLEELFNTKMQHEILLKYAEYDTNLNPQIIDVNYDINKAINEAYSIGRSGNIISNNFTILSTIIKTKNIDIDISLNENELKKILSEISKNLPGTVIESSYYIEDTNLIITKGKEGIVVNEDEFLKRIYGELRKIDSKQEFIEIPINSKKPEEINLEKIKQEIYKKAENAYFIPEPFEVHPEVNGIDFDLEKAKDIFKEEKEEYSIPLIITKPEITLEQIGSEAFPDVLGVCTTKYDMSNVSRTTNLQLAVNKINGKVLLAGEEFSYNATVGERTIAAGYKEAKVYQNGQVVDGLGGGICQISSTLYDAVVIANLEVTQRRNHQFVTSYLPAGKDATVVYGSQDFKFKNTRKYPIKILASITNGVAKIEIKGLKEGNEPDISFDTHTISTIPYSTKYIDDNSMAEGEEKVEQKGNNGIITETYKIERVNGVVTSKTLLSKDTYNAMQRVIRRGTKKTVETNAEPIKENNKDNNNNENKKSNEKQEENKQNKENSNNSKKDKKYKSE